jgi:hypothetical protein
MKPKQAIRRYLSTTIGASLAYVGSVFGVSFFHDRLIDGSAAGILIALVPGIFICLMLFSMWRYLQEIDEVARHELTQGMMTGLFGILAFSGGWGLVERFNETLPPLSLFYVFPAYFLIMGIATFVRWKRWIS